MTGPGRPTPTVPTVGITAVDRDKAVRTLARNAKDADELREWLAMLGLTADDVMMRDVDK
jgi:hypothetical protein